MPATIHERSIEVNGRELKLETGRLAGQASGAVTVRYGDTVVLSTATGEKNAREGLDFLPLTIDYEERMYAAGKIPGGFIKREGRPTESAILAARLTDRPLRPLFPKGYRNEVQIVSTVLSADQENLPDILSIIGASAALTISDIPWNGPVGAARVGDIDGELVVNPTSHQLIDSKLDIVVAGTADAIMMVEGEAKQVPEERLVQAFLLAHDEIRRIVQLQLDLQEIAGKPKREFAAPAENNELKQQIEDFLGDRLAQAVFNPDKESRAAATSALKEEVVAHFTQPADTEDGAAAPLPKEVTAVYESIVKGLVRRSILERGERPDGRKPDEIREIWCQVGYLPRAHGSAIFTRGQTQALSVATMGATSEEQMLDGLGIEESKRYMHHYNFPPYSVGEVRFMRGPSRRDIGHGALSERAISAVLPDEDDFPYTMRVVSEIVSSNGSTSMASVCGSTMALMDAGVPLTAPVAGMAMGLITEEGSGRYAILSDIQGLEDALGDMDFKVAGTRDGVTAIQMDIKVQGITAEIMREALEQARQGRIFILGKMLEAISQPREEMSPYAPRILRIQIQPKQIGEIIGPGGKVIRAIQDETGSKIDIEDDGTVFISAANGEMAQKAIDQIRNRTRTPEVGDIFTGKVKTIIQSGAFVEILPGKDGFVHISELDVGRVESVEDAVQVGDEVTVAVAMIRPDGKINLSRKAVLTGQIPSPGEAPAGGGGGGRGRDGGRDNRGGGGRGRDGGRDNRGGGRPRGEGGGQDRQPVAQSEQGASESSSSGGSLMRRPRDSRTLPGRGGDES